VQNFETKYFPQFLPKKTTSLTKAEEKECTSLFPTTTRYSLESVPKHNLWVPLPIPLPYFLPIPFVCTLWIHGTLQRIPFDLFFPAEAAIPKVRVLPFLRLVLSLNIEAIFM
jgi:hypothetical protein